MIPAHSLKGTNLLRCTSLSRIADFTLSLLLPIGRRELVDGDMSDIVDTETFECQCSGHGFLPFKLMVLLLVAPSEIVYFDDSKADVKPIEDIFYRWKVQVMDKIVLVS
jgi:hypothetical protein